MTIFVVRLKSRSGHELEGIRGLRWILKIALRRYGLRCIDLHEESGAWSKMWGAPIKQTNPDFRE